MKMRLRTFGCPNFSAAALPCGAVLLVSMLSVAAGQERGPSLPLTDVALPLAAGPGGSPVISLGVDAPPRPDLLAPVPQDYARILIDAARHERVDINLMLAILHSENAAFDPAAISPAGAVGLMQLMPATGRALGAADLTVPAQNIRAAARFLHILAEKYRNPVLIASAYRAGEPQVDARASLPLIRETAAYVTRVIGLYTGTNQAQRDIRSAPWHAAAPRRGSPRRDRISSLMLIYSDGGPVMPEPQPALPAGSAGLPARMLKEKP